MKRQKLQAQNLIQDAFLEKKKHKTEQWMFVKALYIFNLFGFLLFAEFALFIFLCWTRFKLILSDNAT